MSEKTTLLRMKGSKQSQPFEAAHAKRLLGYPNTQWEEVADKEDSKASASATTTAKPRAAVAASNKLEVDTTSQPTSV